MSELANYLKLAIARLENIIQELSAAQGATVELEKLQMVLELAREQVQDENISP